MAKDRIEHALSFFEGAQHPVGRTRLLVEIREALDAERRETKARIEELLAQIDGARAALVTAKVQVFDLLADARVARVAAEKESERLRLSIAAHRDSRDPFVLSTRDQVLWSSIPARG